MPVNGKGSDSDDDELAALREAALRSKRMRVEETKPVEAASQLQAASHPVAPLVAACPFDRRQVPRQVSDLQSRHLRQSISQSRKTLLASKWSLLHDFVKFVT